MIKMIRFVFNVIVQLASKTELGRAVFKCLEEAFDGIGILPGDQIEAYLAKNGINKIDVYKLEPELFNRLFDLSENNKSLDDSTYINLVIACPEAFQIL